MDYCEINIQHNGKVIGTINNIEISKRTELAIKCDNWQELVDFVDKWVHEAFISCLTNYYYKKYKVVSL